MSGLAREFCYRAVGRLVRPTTSNGEQEGTAWVLEKRRRAVKKKELDEKGSVTYYIPPKRVVAGCSLY